MQGLDFTTLAGLTAMTGAIIALARQELPEGALRYSGVGAVLVGAMIGVLGALAGHTNPGAGAEMGLAAGLMASGAYSSVKNVVVG